MFYGHFLSSNYSYPFQLKTIFELLTEAFLFSLGYRGNPQ
jgi:hypothetical protein